MNERTVLLVEDNPDYAEMAQLCLVQHNPALKIHTVHDGRQAIDYLLGAGDYAKPRNPRAPDLVILDLELPKVPGLVVLKTMRGIPVLSTVPVVVLSASESPDQVARSLELGANSFVHKTGTFEQQATRLRLIHDHWLGAQAASAQASVGTAQREAQAGS